MKHKVNPLNYGQLVTVTGPGHTASQPASQSVWTSDALCLDDAPAQHANQLAGHFLLSAP